MKRALSALLVIICLSISAKSQVIDLVVNAKKPGAPVQRDMYGIFFEDINFGADGGLYAELIKNRSFDFTNAALTGWTTYGLVEVLKVFLDNARRYDTYDRKGPKVFAGEYAAHTRPVKLNSFEAALAEAAFLTGVERNADVVQLVTYAPLLAHVDAWQWNPDLIWFDNLGLVRSVNYYVQQLYSHNKGAHVLSLTRDGVTVAGEDQLYASAVIDTKTKEIIVKLANTAPSDREIKLKIENPGKGSTLLKQVKATILTGDLNTENTMDKPDNLVPKDYQLELNGNELILSVNKQSFNVYKITFN